MELHFLKGHFLYGNILIQNINIRMPLKKQIIDRKYNAYNVIFRIKLNSKKAELWR